MIRAVLFDLDDTLFDHQHCALTALEAIRSQHACFERVDPAALARSHAVILEELHAEVLAGRLHLDAARIERFRRLYETLGQQVDREAAAAAARAYRAGYVAARREVAGARDLLAALRPHARIVVVSNNVLAEQQEKLRSCGLDEHVDALVVSEEAGVSKPDPGIFVIALARAGCHALEAVMVGDSWPNDVEGARGAGIRPVWFNRDGAPSPDPHIEVITTLAPAADVLAKILRGPAVLRPSLRKGRA